ncbi:MarR family winged helix-turn-helix transcriptional regulator [Paludibacterium purpuratum]|uniref:DNA-binding MarR family transcriptional regulator n=1 Tax=Paludibacterium purpuratum TaxID=1144873 RepID=A0A4R7BCV1_9NEIS|nr:MarR family transcriptional regulator [Paludibacterium purpuratum]TDR81566.1 DNA-binding MarR family transcriptional regulator [Paludibacterium purpuratum]
MTKQTYDTTSDAAALAEDLRGAIGQFVRAVRSQAGTPTTAQGETLAYLERNGSVSIATIAENRGVKHQSMRLVIATLEEAGLVTRYPDPQDGRGVLIALTALGRAEIAEERARRSHWLANAMLHALSTDEMTSLRAAIPLLRKLSDTCGTLVSTDCGEHAPASLR